MLFLHTTGTREEASSIVSVVVGVPFVEMLKKPALEVTRLSDVDEFADARDQFFETGMPEGMRRGITKDRKNNMIRRCISPIFYSGQ